MSNCPNCHSRIPTPTTLDLAAWAEFKCPQCQARLANKGSRSAPLFLLLLAMGLLARQGVIDASVVFALAFFTLLMELYKVMNPQLQLKKPLPTPEITLHLDES